MLAQSKHCDREGDFLEGRGESLSPGARSGLTLGQGLRWGPKDSHKSLGRKSHKVLSRVLEPVLA